MGERSLELFISKVFIFITRARGTVFSHLLTPLSQGDCPPGLSLEGVGLWIHEFSDTYEGVAGR